MRIFVKFNNSNLVVSQTQTEKPLGAGQIPPDMVEVTDRNDGPWLGKIWNPGNDSFDAPPLTKGDYKAKADVKYQVWVMARDTLSGAQAHNESAGIINALTQQEQTCWADYKQALQAWIQAP